MALPDKMACFTGHRELKEDPELLFYKVLEKTEQLIRQGYVYFAAGGARGFDAIAAQAVLKLKEKYPHIRLILVLPMCGRADGPGRTSSGTKSRKKEPPR